jgi:hypothetical protein
MRVSTRVELVHLDLRLLLKCRVEAHEVAGGPRKAGYKPRFDRIRANAEHDRYRRCRFLRGECTGWEGGSRNHGHAATDEIRDRSRGLSEPTLQPAVLNYDVTARDIAGFTQARAESRGVACGSNRCPAIDESNNRHLALLRLV